MRARSPRPLARTSLKEIHQELARRERLVAGLERKRGRLMERVDAIDAQIAANGGSNGRLGRRTRARNKTNLIDALGGVLKGTTLSVTEAAQAVRDAGYQTSSPNFRTMVNAALLNKKRFKRVERGRYTAV